MPDSREPYGRIVHEQRLALNAELEHPRGLLPWPERDPIQRELDCRIGSAVAAEAVRDAKLAAERKLNELGRHITTWFTHHGHNPSASFEVARALAEGQRQILDRDKSSDHA